MEERRYYRLGVASDLRSSARTSTRAELLTRRVHVPAGRPTFTSREYHIATHASPPSSPKRMSDAGDSLLLPGRGRRKAVVVVIGATGAGKSWLTVDLEGHFAGAEAVNTYSMQVYRVLHEFSWSSIAFGASAGVPHHLLGIIDLGRMQRSEERRVGKECLL